MSKAYNTKKYFILICEGETDETALNLVSNRYFKSLSKDVNVSFKVFKGDFSIHSFSDQKEFADPNEIIKRIEKLIKNYYDTTLKPDGIEIKDIIGVASLSDLDGCYLRNEFIIYNEDGNKICYDVSNKCIKTKDVTYIKQRNEIKQIAMDILFDTDIINLKKKKIPYKAFYFNLNMEHVFYNDINNLSLEKKENFAISFRNEYYEKPNEFISFINDLPIVADNYKTSCNNIELKKHPMDRITNIKYLYEWIIELVNKNNISIK